MMVSFLNILWPFLSKRKYLEKYADNESAKKAAMKLWNSLEGIDWVLLIFMFVVVLASCLIYYFPFNRVPGRHYKPKYLFTTWGIVFILVLGATYVLNYLVAKNPAFDKVLLFKFSLSNAIYALVASFLVSFLIEKMGKGYACPLSIKFPLLLKKKHA